MVPSVTMLETTTETYDMISISYNIDELSKFKYMARNLMFCFFLISCYFSLFEQSRTAFDC